MSGLRQITYNTIGLLTSFRRLNMIGVPETRALWTVTLTIAALLAVPAMGTASQPAEETHCVIEVIGEESSGEFVTAPDVCFDTFSEAITHASGGAVMLESSTPGSAA